VAKSLDVEVYSSSISRRDTIHIDLEIRNFKLSTSSALLHTIIMSEKALVCEKRQEEARECPNGPTAIHPLVCLQTALSRRWMATTSCICAYTAEEA
jgi:hypothetical protein